MHRGYRLGTAVPVRLLGGSRSSRHRATGFLLLGLTAEWLLLSYGSAICRCHPQADQCHISEKVAIGVRAKRTIDKVENETLACKQPMHPLALIAEFRVLAPQQDVPAVSDGSAGSLLTRVHHEEDSIALYSSEYVGGRSWPVG
jgi:hypothetical protein